MSTKQSAWDIAQQVADSLPPYLEDDELTVERLWERNKDKMTRKDARALLDQLAESGKLDRQERRKRAGGGHIFAYVTK